MVLAGMAEAYGAPPRQLAMKRDMRNMRNRIFFFLSLSLLRVPVLSDLEGCPPPFFSLLLSLFLGDITMCVRKSVTQGDKVKKREAEARMLFSFSFSVFSADNWCCGVCYLVDLSLFFLSCSTFLGSLRRVFFFGFHVAFA
jgi:hypothetical protein